MVMLTRRFVQYTLLPRGGWTIHDVFDWRKGQPNRPRCQHLKVGGRIADMDRCTRYATGQLQVGGRRFDLCPLHAKRIVEYRTAILEVKPER